MSLTAKRLHDHERHQHRRVSSPDAGSVSPGQRSLNASFNVHSPQTFNLETNSLDGRASSVDSRRAKSTMSAATTGTAAGGPGHTENVKVICRVRPFAKREFELQEELNATIKDEWGKRPLRSVIEMRENITIFLDHEKGFAERQRFEFDVSLWSIPPEQQDSGAKFAGQENVMACVGMPALQNVWNGFNTCIFAYGQTGSGKTHTMMGIPSDPGLIPRMCQELFTSLQRRRQEEDGVVVENTVREYSLEARFLEIYNERVKDLLWELRRPTEGSENSAVDKDNLKIRNFGKDGPVVVGLTTVRVESWEDCLALIEEGTRHRSVAATKMNETSSRSHSIFRLNFVQTTKLLPTKQFEKPKTYDRVSNVSLVDLAGSERNKKTGAEGARLKEAVAINLSLTTLKNVIDALVEGRAVVPYRDSQLTWLLSESLGGNSKTFMISCVSPHWDNAEETLNTLRYAMRAQSIVCHASINESDELKRMNRMRAELGEIQRRIKENPGEDNLKREYHEHVEQLMHLREESTRKEKEARALEDHMARTKAMQFNAAYAHAFKITYLRRAAKHYGDRNVIAEQQVIMKKKEVELQREVVLRKEQDVEAARIEESVAQKRRSKAGEALEALKTRCQELEAQKRSLLVAEDKQRQKLSSKAEAKRHASSIVRTYIAWEAHCALRDLEAAVVRDRQRLNEVSENEEQRKSTAKMEHESRVDHLSHQIAGLRTQIELGQKRHREVLERKSHHIGSLHSEAIFYENENKSCFHDLEEGLAQANKHGSAKYYMDKEELQLKLIRLQTESKEASQSRHESSRTREIEIRSELKHEMLTAESKGENAFEHAQKHFEVEQQRIKEDFERRITKLEALNMDCATFLRRAEQAETLFVPLFNAIRDRVAIAAKPGATIPADASTLAARITSLQVAIMSNLPTKFAPSIETTSPTPLGESTPRRGRSVADLSIRSSPTAVAYNTMSRSTTPGVTQQKARTSVQVAALAPPKKYIALPTRTSLLRSAAHNHKKRPDSGASQDRGSPPVPPLVLRNVSPSRSVSAAMTPREPELVQRKVAVGNTYIVSRSRSPRSTIRSATPTGVHEGERLRSTTSPRRHR